MCSSDLLGQRVPLRTIRALPLPARRHPPAGLADIATLELGHVSSLDWMVRELFGLVTNPRPGWLFCHELMKSDLKVEWIVEAIGRDRKAIPLAQDFAERGATGRTKRSAVAEPLFRFVCANPFFPGAELEPGALDENEGARPNLATPSAVAGRHHGRRLRNLELDCTAAATAF